MIRKISGRLWKEELSEIFREHQKWLENGGRQGRRADLEGADLSDYNLQQINLDRANLQWANLRGVNLRTSSLKKADLRHADLFMANLHRMQRAHNTNGETPLVYPGFDR
jgi:uncharacterized protein YjbI with pentapeptide repeats